MSPLREEIRYKKLQETENGDQEQEEEEEEVTVYLYSHSSRSVIHRERCLRIFASILLLAVAIGFVLYELEFRSLEHLETEAAVHTEEHGSHHHEDQEMDGRFPAAHSHSSGTFHRAAVVTDSETCSMVARDVLQSDGSVVDAGIAAVLCLSVVHPHTSSLGGVFTSIYYNSTSQNASVLTAIPSEASPTTYGFPQVLQGLWSLHQQHGRKPWSELLSAAINLANQGFLVDTNLHAALEEHRTLVTSSVGLRSLFCHHNNSLKGVGEIVENTPLGSILAQAANVTADSAASDVLINNLLSDIEVTERERFAEAISGEHLASGDPLTLHVDGLTLYSTTEPTAGTILSATLREIYNEGHEITSNRSSEFLINASKIMYIAGGAWPGDSTASPSLQPPRSPASVRGNVIIADSYGDVFVISLTLNSTFGSGTVSPSTGILLSDFVQGSGSTEHSSTTFWACPSVLLLGGETDVLGVSGTGGSSLPFSLAQIILNRVLLQKDLTESVTGTLVDLKSGKSDPWLQYFGLQGRDPEPVEAVEIYAEHVHVATSHTRLTCCYPVGL